MLYTTVSNNIGQVKEENAQQEIDRLNTSTNQTWRKDYSDKMFVSDETDEDIENPCIRNYGYVFITCEPK